MKGFWEWVFMLLVLCVLIFCGYGLVWSYQHGNDDAEKAYKNRDPQVGPVYSNYPTAWKICDGPNLLYKSEVRGGISVSVSTNDGQCAK